MTTVHFGVDSTSPEVSGVTNNQRTNQPVTITFNEGTATLNGEAFESGSTVSNDGEYDLVVTDLAGNITTVHFSLNTKLPVITITEYVMTPTNKDVVVSASVNKGTLNQTSHTFTENGSFTFVAVDEYGNVSKRQSL